jgi:hypothetical protein
MAEGQSEIRKIVGSPWQLLNLSDFIIIGLEAALFMLILQVLGLGWHRLFLLRCTGSAVSPSRVQSHISAQQQSPVMVPAMEAS